MATAAPPAAEPRTHRSPWTVTVAGVLVIVQAALQALASIALVLLLGFFIAAFGQVFGGRGNSSEATGLIVLIVAAGVVLLAINGLFIFFGVKVLQRRQWARITVIILEGLGLLGYAGNVLTFIGSSVSQSASSTAQAPSFYLLLSVIPAAVNLAVIVLLLSPSARQAFGSPLAPGASLPPPPPAAPPPSDLSGLMPPPAS